MYRMAAAVSLSGKDRSVLRGHQRAQLLADERGQHERPESAVETSDPPSARFAADDDERSPGGEGAAEAGQRSVSSGVEDDVVALPAVGDVPPCVVDDVIGPDGRDQVHLRRAAHPGDVRTECLGDLDDERPDAAGRADDQHPLPGLYPPSVADCLQSSQTRDADSGRLLRRQVRRRGCELARGGAGVLGEAALGDAEHLVAHV